MEDSEVIRVYVGADRSQQAAIKVLEYSIKRHTTARVEVIPMIDLDVPIPKDPRNWQRTGFSFSRFCIPKLAGYTGKAIYMDADMQVFKDIRSLWSLPFNGTKVQIQESVDHQDISLSKENAPSKRIKQCAVMLLDCANLDWDISAIVNELDQGKYNYEQLMYDLCVLNENEIGYTVPFEWNSLEYFDQDTCLLHYTDMGTQPWVSTNNPLVEIWLGEVRRMIAEGVLDIKLLQEEIRLGYFRPSLIREIKYGHLMPSFLKKLYNKKNAANDAIKGYIPHKEVYEKKRIRNKNIKAFEASEKLKA